MRTFNEILNEDKNITKLIYFDENLINEKLNEYDKSFSICFNSYATDDKKMLSNHCTCRIEYNGIVFNSVEQIYNYMRYYNHNDIREDIMSMRYPNEIKNKCSRYYINLCDDVRMQPNGFKANLLFFSQRLKIQQNECVRKAIEDRIIKVGKIKILPQLVEYTWWNDTKNGTVDVDKNFVGDYKRGVVKGQNRSGIMLRRAYREYQKGLLNIIIPPPYDYIL